MSKKNLSVYLFILLASFLCSCGTESTNNVPENNAPKILEDSEISNDSKQIDVYAGPGTDYLPIGTIDKNDIKETIKIEGTWAEIEFGTKRGYVEVNKIPELCTNKVPRVTYDINQNVYPYPILYNIKVEVTLFDDANTYYLPKSSGSSEVIPAGEVVTILCIEKSNIINYAQIEINREGIKRRCYSSITDLLSLDNPLRNFDSVKSTNALITHDGTEYYSSSGETTALSNGWNKKAETTISKTEWDILSGITNIIKSNDINDEALISTEGKIQLYSFKDRQYINANTKNGKLSNIINVADFILGSTISFVEGAKDTLNLKIELDEYQGEHKIVIKAGKPIESVHAGKRTWLSSLIVERNNTPLTMIEAPKRADNLIKSIYPDLDKSKTYDMEITFSKDFDENSYGYYIVIDNNLNVYAMPIIHNGTSLSVYSKGEFICDAGWDLASSMLQLDDESAKNILELLSENGFIIQGFTNTPSIDILSIWENYVDSIGESSVYFLPADYDGDNLEEAFAITGTSDGEIGYYNAKIYFIDSEGNITCVCDKTYSGDSLYGYLHQGNDTNDYLLTTATSKFIVWEVSAYGSGSVSIILGVKDGMAYEPDISNCYMDFGLTDNGKFVGLTSYFTSEGHQYDERVFIFDENSGQFILQ